MSIRLWSFAQSTELSRENLWQREIGELSICGKPGFQPVDNAVGEALVVAVEMVTAFDDD